MKCIIWPLLWVFSDILHASVPFLVISPTPPPFGELFCCFPILVITKMSKQRVVEAWAMCGGSVAPPEDHWRAQRPRHVAAVGPSEPRALRMSPCMPALRISVTGTQCSLVHTLRNRVPTWLHWKSESPRVHQESESLCARAENWELESLALSVVSCTLRESGSLSTHWVSESLALGVHAENQGFQHVFSHLGIRKGFRKHLFQDVFRSYNLRFEK